MKRKHPSNHQTYGYVVLVNTRRGLLKNILEKAR